MAAEDRLCGLLYRTERVTRTRECGLLLLEEKRVRTHNRFYMSVGLSKPCHFGGIGGRWRRSISCVDVRVPYSLGLFSEMLWWKVKANAPSQDQRASKLRKPVNPEEKLLWCTQEDEAFEKGTTASRAP